MLYRVVDCSCAHRQDLALQLLSFRAQLDGHSNGTFRASLQTGLWAYAKQHCSSKQHDHWVFVICFIFGKLLPA